MTVTVRHDMRDSDGKHRYEDEAMEIVNYIHKTHAPAMDTNDGGHLLSWILGLVDRAITDRESGS